LKPVSFHRHLLWTKHLPLPGMLPRLSGIDRLRAAPVTNTRDKPTGTALHMARTTIESCRDLEKQVAAIRATNYGIRRIRLNRHERT
jgi:hypothetical protein